MISIGPLDESNIRVYYPNWLALHARVEFSLRRLCPLYFVFFKTYLIPWYSIMYTMNVFVSFTFLYDEPPRAPIRFLHVCTYAVFTA